jgi:hypothetical protein
MRIQRAKRGLGRQAVAARPVDEDQAVVGAGQLGGDLVHRLADLGRRDERRHLLVEVRRVRGLEGRLRGVGRGRGRLRGRRRGGLAVEPLEGRLDVLGREGLARGKSSALSTFFRLNAMRGSAIE